MIDSHIHSAFSPDTTQDTEEQVTKAIELGGKVLGFTEHLNKDYIHQGFTDFSDLDFYAYSKKIDELREKYNGKIKILKGIEIGFGVLASQLESKEILSKVNFDYAINSVHLPNGENFWDGTFFKNRTREEVFNLYLSDIVKSLTAEYDYQIIGHIGNISRIYPGRDYQFDVKTFKDKLAEIFEFAIKHEKCIELNVSTLDRGLSFPNTQLLGFYKELGGSLLTYSSDAHRYFNLYQKYNEAADFAKSIGFTNYVYYENKKPVFYKI